MSKRTYSHSYESNVFANGSQVIQRMIAQDQKNRLFRQIQFNGILEKEKSKQTDKLSYIKENHAIRSRHEQLKNQEQQQSNTLHEEKIRNQRKLTDVQDWQIRQKSLETQKKKLEKQESKNKADIELEMIKSYHKSRTQKKKRDLNASKISKEKKTDQSFYKKKRVITPINDRPQNSQSSPEHAKNPLISDKYSKLIQQQLNLEQKILQLKDEEMLIFQDEKKYHNANKFKYPNSPNYNHQSFERENNQNGIIVQGNDHDLRINDSVYNDVLQPIKQTDIDKSSRLTKKQMITLPYSMKDRMYGRCMAYLNREGIDNKLEPKKMYHQIKNNYEHRARFNIITGE